MNTEDTVMLRIIASTDRKTRPFGLYEVASDIKYLVQHYGSLKKVSELVNISSGMLNQFLKVDNLSKKALSLVKSRKIDSVSIVNSLSKFAETEQDTIVGYVINGELNSLDIRLLIPLKNSMPNESIEYLIDKLQNSKNIKISVIKFYVSETSLRKYELVDKFELVCGHNNIISIEIEDDMYVVKISNEGEKELRKSAKEKKMTFSNFVYHLIS